jgi:hypothetical protein
VHVQHPLRPGALVQIIDILRDYQQFAYPVRVEIGQRLVRGIGLDRSERAAALIVEVEHQRAIERQRLGRTYLFDTAPLPQPIRPAKGRKPALRRNARAGEDDDVGDVGHARMITREGDR